MYINGNWIDSESGEKFPAVNPANGEAFESVPAGSAHDVGAALDAAQTALKSWRNTPPSQRAEYVLKAALMIREHLEEIARIDTTEVGKPIKEARREVGNGATACLFFSGLARRMYSNVVDSDQPLKHAMVIRRPVGVVGVITPWNDPISLASWGIAPALVAGNTVVFKPSSLSSVVSSKLVEIFERTGLPKGVLNMVTGRGSQVGEALISDKRVNMVVFTGESATGKHIAQVNAPMLRKQVMELGGKNPLIVARDANLPVAVHAALYAAFSSAGQKCTAASRIIVEEPVIDEFARKFAAGASSLTVGNGLREDVDMGPVVSRSQQEKVLGYIEAGKAEGAKILAGGGKYTDEERSRGFFVQPTVFGDVSNGMKIAQEEIFGPVTAIIPAKNIDDAIEIANDTRYGLSSAIYTRNLNNMFKAIQEIDAGLTFVNQGTVGPEVGAPFGGVKDSGFSRELGEEALEHFTEKKTVYIDYSDSDRPWFFANQIR
ncbi:MAG: aldehyde dehydrogenase family protein [Thermoprotei archaeon]